MQGPAAVKTLLFTDIEGSTRLWEQAPERMRPALASHDALARAAVQGHRGIVVKMSGDGLHAAFDDPLDAISACVQLQQALADPGATDGIAFRVRCGLHAGVDECRDNDFFGRTVNRASRIMAAAHGGQVLLSQAVAALVGERLPRDVELRDLGLVRLRDLEVPERVYQLVHPGLRSEFPALRSLAAIPNNLPPHATTTFIGRERQIAEVGGLLEKTRLLTLHGMGGIGKTRLSLQVAAGVMGEFPDGVWLVELANLADPQVVPVAVASVVGVREESGQPVIEALLRFVKDRALLLILDNCEHVLDACVRLTSQLLQAGPKLRILASSREPLHIAGETSYAVPALKVPSPNSAVDASDVEFEAVSLFIDRARSARASLTLTQQQRLAVADICRRLDGIPLAIELAAARVRVLSVETIAARLGDRFGLLTRGDSSALPRQQTLRATMDWSFDLLTEPERMLFRRLAVFAGSWSLEAAEAVGAGSEVSTAEVLPLLANLVEKSLVSMDPEVDRYQLLETVRKYAQERLGESADGDSARTRHFTFFLALAEQAGSQLSGPGQGEWLTRLSVEAENLLAAVAWCAQMEGGDKASLRLLHAIKLWIISRGLLGLGYRLMKEALHRAGAGDRDLIRCQALCSASELAFLTGRYERAKQYVDESLSIALELGEAARVAEACRVLGYVSLAHGDRIAARGHFDAALALARDSGDRSRLAAALNGLAELHRTQGELDRARPLYEEAVMLDRDVGDRRRLAVHLCNLASVLIETGAEESSPGVLLEALTIAREIGLRQVGRAVLEYSAGLGALHRQWSLAARLYGAAQMQAERMGHHREPTDEAFLPPLIGRTREALGEAGFGAAEATGRALSYDAALTDARAWLERAHEGV